MKVFLGVIVGFVVIALIFRLTRKQETPGEQNVKQQIMMESTNPSTPMHTVTVEEVIQTASYTYMKVKENLVEYWIAAVKEEVSAGSKYSYASALEMVDFKSKELNRTFPSIYFVSQSPEQSGNQGTAAMPSSRMERPKAELKADKVISQSAGGISIAELFKNRSNYANKKIKVKGKVAKVNNEVMARNWVHLQDGTNDSGNFDLTVTTQ